MRIGRLSLLVQVVRQIAIPPAVRDEVVVKGAGAVELARAPWLRIQQPSDPSAVERLAHRLDRGEAEAIALALELGAVLLVDERRGRQRATELNIPIVGTGGLLLSAKERGLISEVHPLLTELEQAGVHLGERLIRTILRLAGEDV